MSIWVLSTKKCLNCKHVSDVREGMFGDDVRCDAEGKEMCSYRREYDE